MSSFDANVTTSPQGESEVEGAIHAFTRVLHELEDGHRLLEARAERVEAELSVANATLAQKVEELERLHRELRAILTCLPTGVLVLGPDGRVGRVNRAALEMLGMPEDQVLGTAPPAALLNVAEDGTTVALERPQGGPWSLGRRSNAVRTDDGELLGTLEILEDRRELSRVTERMHQQGKMAALGTVAGGIAHEVRNPMNAIRGFAALLARELGDDDKGLRFARLIEQGVDEVDAIISSVLAFADPERLCSQTLRGSELAEAVREQAQRDLLARATPDAWTLEIACSLDVFVGDLIQLRQALRNLIANAVDVQPNGGRVLLTLEQDGEEACLFVEDAGPGIDPALTSRLRDPFFTTRADGTGLGLALVDTIARLHGGSLEVSPAAGSLGGARIGLRIPLTPGPAPRPSATSV